MARAVNGVHVKRARTVTTKANDPGRVHIYAWTGFDRGWRPACQPTTRFYGEVLDDASPARVSCRNCLRTGLVPTEWKPMEAE